ncbi:CapA family protein [Halosimplex aquaticum]|uniref:CapA family protein n=1 Tax=Halosimplex aquaticum TaxID=3026162 RepID=A0ABD5Y5V4_9EURY|nr:CapA family protein [Halosimplex aquaticum]
MPRIGLTGDVMLGRLVDERYRQPGHDAAAIWGNLHDRLRDLDGLLVNLECAVSTRGRQWTRTRRPFHFRATPDWATEALATAGVDFACLANNHLLDYEEPALLDTLDHLDAVDVAHAGAARTIAEAREPALFTAGDIDVAVVAATDNTPEYAAGPDSPGVCHLDFDPTEEVTRTAVEGMVADARARNPDLVVASVHGGPNMETAPSDALREFHRWLAERVDLVHGHSAHVFQGVEVVDGTPVLHDCGDFVDDYRVDQELRNDRGFLFVAETDESGVRSLRLEPIEIRDRAVYAAERDVGVWCRETMRERSEPYRTHFHRDGDALVLNVA